jgi:hypothetical protein
VSLNYGITYELEKIWKEAIVAYSRYYAGNSLEGLKKAAKNLNQDNMHAS